MKIGRLRFSRHLKKGPTTSLSEASLHYAMHWASTCNAYNILIVFNLKNSC